MARQNVEFEFPDPEKETEESFEIEVEGIKGEEPLQKPGDAKVEKAEEKAEEKTEEVAEEKPEIEIVDDTPKADKGKKPAPPPEPVKEDELEEYSEKVQKRLKQFTKSYHDERRAKEALLRERQELDTFTRAILQENEQLKGTVSKSQDSAVAQAKSAVEGQLASARLEYKRAYEDGDPDKVLEAQEKLTAAKIKADRLASYKPKPLQTKTDTVKRDTVVPVSEPAPQVQVDTRAEEWASDNEWFGSDDEMTAFALGVHNKLAKEGVDLQSDEYYEKINSRMRQVYPDQFTELSGEEENTLTPKAEKAPDVVAPATRTTASNKIKLTKSAVALAKRLNIPLDLYAAKVAEQQKR